MKKNKRLLGIKNPDALDFIVAIIFGIVTIGAIWLGAFISMNKAYLNSQIAWQNFVDAFVLKFEQKFTWQGLVSSIIIYLGASSAVVLILASLIKRSFRGIVGAINVCLCAIGGVLFFNFFCVFANPIQTKITGIFPIGLIVICVFLLYCAKLSIDLSISYMNEKNQKPEEPQVQYVYVNNPAPQSYDEDYNSYNDEYFKQYDNYDNYQDEEEPVEDELDNYEEYIVESINGEPATVEVVETQPEEEEPEEILDIEPVEIKTVEFKQESGLKAINVLKLTFEEKLKRASKDVRVHFKELKQYFEEIGFKCKITKHGAIFYHRNIKQAVITVSGKSALRVYYKLDYYKYVDSSIPLIYVPDVKKYEKTPVYLKVKSELSVRRAKQLMDDIKSNIENE